MSPPGAGPQEIRSAYLKLSREFHPDRHNESANRAEYKEVTINLNRAYEALKQGNFEEKTKIEKSIELDRLGRELENLRGGTDAVHAREADGLAVKLSRIKIWMEVQSDLDRISDPERKLAGKLGELDESRKKLEVDLDDAMKRLAQVAANKNWLGKIKDPQGLEVARSSVAVIEDALKVKDQEIRAQVEETIKNQKSISYEISGLVKDGSEMENFKRQLEEEFKQADEARTRMKQGEAEIMKKIDALRSD